MYIFCLPASIASIVSTRDLGRAGDGDGSGLYPTPIFTPSPPNRSHPYRKTVTATASTQEKLDWLLSLPAGPTHAVNYKTQNFAEQVKQITQGHGTDVIVDMVGQSHWDRNIDALAVDGRMTLLAFLSGM